MCQNAIRFVDMTLSIIKLGKTFAAIKTVRFNEVEKLVHKTIDRLTDLRITLCLRIIATPPVPIKVPSIPRITGKVLDEIWKEKEILE